MAHFHVDGHIFMILMDMYVYLLNYVHVSSALGRYVSVVRHGCYSKIVERVVGVGMVRDI